MNEIKDGNQSRRIVYFSLFFLVTLVWLWAAETIRGNAPAPTPMPTELPTPTGTATPTPTVMATNAPTATPTPTPTLISADIADQDDVEWYRIRDGVAYEQIVTIRYKMVSYCLGLVKGEWVLIEYCFG